jgi:hypothetical protein
MTTQPTPRQVMVVQQLPPVAWCVGGLGRLLSQAAASEATA